MSGLNKAARLAAKRAEQASKQQAALNLPLDPPFPYEPAPFDAAFFDVESSLPESAAGEIAPG